MPNRTTPVTDEGAISEMTAVEFLSLLKRRHIQIEAHEGRLRISAPTGAMDAVLRAELKERKQELLDLLSKAAPAEILPFNAAELRGRIPLTAAQEGMWLIDHFSPGGFAYNIPEAFGIDERTDRETLQWAVDRLLERHSILRTSFHEEDGELSQSIAAAVEAHVGFTDLSSLVDEDRERSCRELIRSEGRRPFDLSQAPMVRFHLFRLAERRHVIFVNMHHIISDRRSMYVLREELLALSRLGGGGNHATLPSIQLHFADYAAWTYGQMNTAAIQEQVAYWKQKMAGLPAYLELPHTRPWPEKRTSAGATKKVIVFAATRTALSKVGTEEGASPFMTFLAFFAVAVARWSRDGEPGRTVDFCIGSPITHRKHPATERMIGPFVNMLAFRCRIGPGMSFREVLRQVRGTAIEAYENGDLPFRKIVREVNPDRRSQRSPIFQIMFGYETYVPPVANEFQMDAEPGTARYDLSLHLWEMANSEVKGLVEYCTDLFEDAEIDRFLAASDDIAVGISHDPDQDVFSIPAYVTRSLRSDDSIEEHERENTGSASSTEVGPRGDALKKFVRLFSSL